MTGKAFILPTLGIDALGCGLVAPIVPELVRELAGNAAAWGLARWSRRSPWGGPRSS